MRIAIVVPDNTGKEGLSAVAFRDIPVVHTRYAPFNNSLA